MAIGRPRTCECGTCGRCKNRERNLRWYQRKTLPERRAVVARRDPELRRAGRRGRRRTDVATQARWTVRNAVRDGRLVRLPCIVCGDPNTHGHHANGYDRAHWLDVRWLCKTHHDEAHGIVRPGF